MYPATLTVSDGLQARRMLPGESTSPDGGSGGSMMTVEADMELLLPCVLTVAVTVIA